MRNLSIEDINDMIKDLREVKTQKIQSSLVVGAVVKIKNDNSDYRVQKINKTRFVGRNNRTNVEYNIPFGLVTDFVLENHE